MTYYSAKLDLWSLFNTVTLEQRDITMFHFGAVSELVMLIFGLHLETELVIKILWAAGLNICVKSTILQCGASVQQLPNMKHHNPAQDHWFC